MKKLKYFLFLFIIFLCPFVKADSFSGVTIAYGYDRGTQTGIWSGYSSTLDHNFGTGDPNIGYINTLNIQTILNNNYQNGNFYNITFNLQNDYSQYTSNFTLYDALQEMGHFNLKCAVSSTGGFSEPQTCFTNYNIRFEKTSNNSVKGIVSITPLINFQRLLINITREGTPEGSQLISEYFKLSNFSYTVSTGGTGEIIDNQNQNTQDIINNQNENTQEIINNINENFNGCFNYSNIYSKNRNPYNDNVGYLSTNGSVVNSSLFRYTYYLIVTKDKTYFINRTNNNIAQSYCLYDSNKTLISCTQMGSSLSTNFVPSEDGYVRISYSVSTGDSLEFSGQYCTSKFNELNEDVLSGANSIKDSIDKQIESQSVCTIIDKSFVIENKKYINSSGGIADTTSTSVGITDYIDISNASLSINELGQGTTYYCFYDDNKVKISCFQLTQNFSSVPTNAKYLRSTIYNGRPIFKLCKNGNQSISDSINNTNDYLQDDSDPIISDSALNDVFGRVHFSDPLSYLLTLPTQLINKIVSMSDTCSPIDLGTLYGVHLTLPCINLENYLGSDLWNILDVILSVGLLSVIFKNFYDTISNLLTLGGQKEAKEKFSMPTPMDFLAMILGGDNK